MREQEHFFVNNYQDLARETARGDGELLRTLADTLHCPERIRNRLAAVTQHNHRDIFSQSDALAGFVRLKTQIHNDDILNTACREATQPARPVRYSRYASAVGEQPSRKNEDTQPQVPTDPLPLQYNPDAQSIPLQETTPGGSQPQPQIAPKTQPSPQLLPPVTQPVRTAARHPSYGMAGCGLGSMVFKNNVRSEQWLASIINDAIIPQSIVITTGTSNCVDTDTADMHSEQEIFIENNLNALQLESARGEGASLRALADLLGCEDVTSHAALASLAQNQHAYIFSDNHPHSIGLRYRNVFGASPSIKKHCKRLF